MAHLSLAVPSLGEEGEVVAELLADLSQAGVVILAPLTPAPATSHLQ